MAVCPNCGGMLRFDIAGQCMKCDSCTSTFDPYAFQYGGSAEESTEYDVTVFKCPQCGGEIFSTDQTAAGFCSYCGSSNVLESHLTKEKRPEFIIPFKKTKEDCKNIFKSHTKKALFAPADFKSEGRIDSFRGIYMPYWLYDMSQNNPIDVKTSTSHRRGDYIITDHYICGGFLDCSYNGVSYDASSAFADDISNEIAPFNVKDITEFSPAFLSGFYADLADVPVNTYEDAAIDLAQEGTYNYIKKSSPMSKESFDESKAAVKGRIKTEINAERSAMFPVWFMTYRNRDRVAYATVNGQTGRVSSDIPVSVPKYLLCAGIIAVILFFIFQMFFTLLPGTVLTIIGFVSLISGIMYASQMKSIVAQENHDDDLGLRSRMDKKKQSRLDAQKGAYFADTDEPFVLTERDIKNSKRRRKEAKKNENKGTYIVLIVAMIFIGIPILFSVFGGILTFAFSGSILSTVIVGLSLLVNIILTVTSSRNIKLMDSKKGISSLLWTVMGLGISLGVLIVNPVADIIYYIAAVAAMVGILIALIDMILCYNLLAMRPLPQFEMYKGGDDRA